MPTNQEKHSHGQWTPGHLCNDSHSCNCAYILSDGYMGAVASVHWSAPDHDPEGDNPPLEEAKANQRLIAAAPELLEACKLASDYTDSLPPKIMEVIKEAIAKAEGK